jgi:hypothetical protein
MNIDMEVEKYIVMDKEMNMNKDNEMDVDGPLTF